MQYELSRIEQELQPNHINKSFSNLKSQNIQHISKKTLNRLRSVFSSEFIRIKAAFVKEKLNLEAQPFEQYLKINYRALLSLKKIKKTSIIKSLSAEITENNDIMDIIDQIIDHLHTDFIRPLREFLETHFKHELTINNLLVSPIKVFLKALKQHNVRISIHQEYLEEQYKPIYSPSVNKLFTLEYNDFMIEALFNDHFEEIYTQFQSYTQEIIESLPSPYDKLKLLNAIKSNLSSVNAFYYQDHQQDKNNHPKLKLSRLDASNSLKHKLHLNKALKDFNVFHEALIPFTEIQKIYITRAFKFIKSCSNLQKLTLKEKNLKDPVGQTDKNQLSIPFGNCPEPPEKLQWRGNANQLIAFFYDASTQVIIDGEPILKASQKQLVRFLSENFIQKDGDPINPSTIKTIFTPSKEQKRPPLDKRINIPLK